MFQTIVDFMKRKSINNRVADLESAVNSILGMIHKMANEIDDLVAAAAAAKDAELAAVAKIVSLKGDIATLTASVDALHAQLAAVPAEAPVPAGVTEALAALADATAKVNATLADAPAAPVEAAPAADPAADPAPEAPATDAPAQ